jgi:hypothetical protein
MMTISSKAITLPRAREDRANEAKRTATMPKQMTLTLTPEALALLEPIRPTLQEFWRTEGAYLKPGEALYRIEKRFGDQIVANVCIPLGFRDFECLIIARAVAEGVDRLTLTL